MSAIRSIEAFYENLGIPDTCTLGKRVFKKQFYEHGQLGAADKAAFVEDIEGIEWRFTLKPSTINIPKLEDDTHEYLEIAVLQVTLTGTERLARIAAVIQKAIPYPLLILFVSGNGLEINAADKRINRADANKIVVEAVYDSSWIDTAAPMPEQDAFLSDFRARNFSYRSLYDFYQDAVGRLVALRCAGHTGRYEPPGVSGKPKADRLEALRLMDKLQQERAETRNKLKKEKNLGTQVGLNTRIKQLSDRIEAIRNDL